MLDLFLIVITLAVAVIGTLKEKPTRKEKMMLIGLAVLASAGSFFKTRIDASDKDFLQTMMISILHPSGASYAKIYNDINDTIHDRKIGIGLEDGNCFHSDDGMACFLSDDKSKHGTLVFDSAEVGAMYANDLHRTSNKEFIASVPSRRYDPKLLEDDFLDRVGVLGASVFFNEFHRWPESSYTYDDEYGVKVRFQENSLDKEVLLSSDELKKIQAAKSIDLFYALEEKFREKFKAARASDVGGSGH